MPNYKIDCFFETNAGLPAGWVETFYVNDARTIDSALRPWQQGAYPQARLGILSPLYSWPIVRISDVDKFRDSLISYGTAGTTQGTYATPPSEVDIAEEPWDALLIRLSTSLGGFNRSFLMRGLPHGVTDATYSYGPVPQWPPLFDAWVTALKANGACVRNQTTTPPGANAPAPAEFPTSVILNPDKRSLTFVWNPGGPSSNLVPGRTIIVKGITDACGVNKRWRVASTTLSTMTTSPGRNPICGTPTLNRCSIQPIWFALSPIAFVQPLRGAKKSTGRPFDVLRGRRLRALH